MKPARVVVAGGMNVDLVVKTPHLPRPGETVRGRKLTRIAGGKGLNQATAASRAGATVWMIGVTGDDAEGQFLIDRLVEDRVLCVGVRRIPGQATGVALIAVSEVGENLIIVASGANDEANREMVMGLTDVICEADVIVSQLEWPIEAVQTLLETARPQAIRVLNAAPSTKLALRTLERVDILVVNEIEAESLSSLAVRDVITAKRAAVHLLDYGPRAVIVTLGAAGALAVEQMGAHLQPAPRIEVVDSTAAGDAFVGALACALAEGKTLEKAMAFGVCAGSLACTVLGAWPSLPRRPHIEAKLTTLPTMVAV